MSRWWSHRRCKNRDCRRAACIVINIVQLKDRVNAHECPDGQFFKLGLHLLCSEQRDQEHGRKENADIPTPGSLLLRIA